MRQSYNSLFLYIALVSVNAVYACTSIFTKMASLQEMLSWRYLFWIVCAIGVIGVYALLWQQIIARLPISVAYMFKGTSIIFMLLFSALFFGETITITNVVGSFIIILGIFFFAIA